MPQPFSTASKDGAKLWKGWFSAGWEEGSFDSLITEEMTRLDWSLKHNFRGQNSSWSALQTDELLPLQEKRRKSCADRQLWPEGILPVQQLQNWG